MRATLIYPVIAKGTPKGARNQKNGLLFEEMSFDIPEVTADEAPIAMLVRQEHDPYSRFKKENPIRVRYHDGKLYISTDNHPRFRKECADRLRLPGLAEITHRLCDQAIVSIENTLDKTEFWPISSKSIVKYKVDDGAINLTRNRQEQDAFAISEDGLERAEHWRGQARDTQNGLLVIDGELWETCDEPVYSVAMRASRGIKVRGASPTTVLASMHFMFHGLVNSDVRVFNALEHDIAVAAKEKAIPDRPRYDARETDDHIDVLIPEAVSYPAAEREMDRLARYLVDNFGRSIKDGCVQRGDIWFSSIPSSLLTAWCQLRDIVERYRPLADKVPESLEPTVETYLQELARRNNGHLGFSLLGSLTQQDIDELYARWQDREIIFDPIRTPVSKRSFAP